MASEYLKGQTTRISNEFKVAGVLTDPTTVTLTIYKPDGTSTPYTYALGQVNRESAGTYYKDISLDQVGIWNYEWIGTGACEAVDKGWLEVYELEPAAGFHILSADEAATVLRCDNDDPNMIQLLPAIDAQIMRDTGRFWEDDPIISEQAKKLARLWLVNWHEDPGGNNPSQATALSAAILAATMQLQAEALFYHTFEGLAGAGSVELTSARKGDSVISLVGRVGATGDQSAKFESVISENGYLKQIASEDLTMKWFTAHLVPPGEMA